MGLPQLRALFAEVRKARRAREGAWSNPGHIFTTATGVQWHEQNFERSWLRLRRRCVDDGGKALIRPLSFHCTRHTFVSWALESGKSIVWKQHALGHASPDTTLHTYSHFIPKDREDMGFLRLV